MNIPKSGPYRDMDQSSSIMIPTTFASFMTPISGFFESLSPNIYWFLMVSLFCLGLLKLILTIIHGIWIKAIHNRNKLDDDVSTPRYKREKTFLI